MAGMELAAGMPLARAMSTAAPPTAGSCAAAAMTCDALVAMVGTRAEGGRGVVSSVSVARHWQ